MRRRHWLELMIVTGKTDFNCPNDPDDPNQESLLTFADIMALHLHEYQRDVEEITDRAQKEAKKESILHDLETRGRVSRLPWCCTKKPTCHCYRRSD
jgi:hypothetical protein